MQKAFEEATGKEIEARVVEDDQLEGFFAEAFKPPMAGMFVEMTRSFLPGGVGEKDMNEGVRVQKGRDKLGEALKRMLEK